MSTVTLALAKAHMNIDSDADDELIQLYLDAAEAWLGNYIGKPFTEYDPIPTGYDPETGEPLPVPEDYNPKLDRTIYIERETETVSPSGAVVTAWTNIATARAEIVQQSASEFFTGYGEAETVRRNANGRSTRRN